MYKKDNIIAILGFISLCCLSLKCNIKITENDITNFITFLSIYTGFLATSFSIMSENTQIKKLRKIKDSENPALTLLHRLTKYYQFVFIVSLLTILLLLLTNMLNIFLITNIIILGLMFLILYSSYTVIKILFDIFTGKIVVENI